MKPGDLVLFQWTHGKRRGILIKKDYSWSGQRTWILADHETKATTSRYETDLILLKNPNEILKELL